MGTSHDASLHHLRNLVHAVPRSMGLPQLAALIAVAIEPGLSVNDVAERIEAPQQTASRYVSILLGRYEPIGSTGTPTPLLEQRVSDEDPRKRALFLTSEGRDLVRDLLTAGWPSGK